MGLNSRVVAGVAAVFLWMPPVHAQQPEPSLPEQLIEGVRSLFGRIFGGGPTPEPPGAERPAAAEPVVPAARPSAEPPVAIAPAALPLLGPSRSLHEAVVNGDYDVAVKLLEQGADIESKDPGSGASPLHYAVMKGRMAIVDLLISRGADVNSRTRNRTTPLHTAALYAKKEVAERLLDKNAEINAVSASGSTPLALAAAARNHPIADMLRLRGAK